MQTASLSKVLAIRSFRNLWISQIISQISQNMLTFVLAILVYEQTRSNAAVSLLYLTIAVPATIFGLWSGVLVDRSNKKRFLLISTLGRAGLLLLLFLSRDNLPVLFLLVAVISLVGQFFLPAAAALLRHFVPYYELLSANSLFTLTFYGAIIGGFVIAGPLLAVLGIESMLVGLTFLFVFCALIILFLPREKKNKQITLQKGQVLHDVKQTFSFIQKTPGVFMAIGLLTLTQAVLAIIATLGPGFADKILATRLTDASISILGPAALGMVIGAILIGNIGQRFKKSTIVMTGFFASVLLLLVLSLVAAPWTSYSSHPFLTSVVFHELMYVISVLCFFGLGFANSIVDVVCNTTLQEQTTDVVRGKIYGLLASLISGVAVLPVVVSGVIADTFGIATIFITLTITMFVISFQIKRRARFLH
ncbi:MFS transporter [Candidatus Microgenomates bacterium]|nr:MAG: MFS transporter [Candidatus Microgenomates bacterium]